MSEEKWQISRPIDKFIMKVLEGKLWEGKEMRSQLEMFRYVSSMLERELLEVGEDMLRERNKQSMKEHERRGSFDPSPGDFGEDLSLMFEEDWQAQWRNRIKSITQQRRMFCPSFIFSLSFYFRTFCRSYGYFPEMFEQVKQDVKQEADNDMRNYYQLFCISLLNRFPAPYPEHYDLAPRETPGRGSELETYMCHGLNKYKDLMLVTLYAMVGLHRYNILNGTNLDLYDLRVVTKARNRFSTFFITFLAYNPTVDGFENISDSQKTTFHVRVDQMVLCGELYVVCPVATPSPSPSSKMICRGDFPQDESLPHWPTKRDVDDKRFYVLKNDEWLYAHDWIYFYLHLLCYSTYSSLSESQLYSIKIVAVAIETLGPEKEVEPLKPEAKNCAVYIKFRDWNKADRKGTIKRVFHKLTGLLSLVGQIPLDIEPEWPSLTSEW